jgi:hypothetical protein
MISLMIALKAHFDGKVLVPDEPLALAPNQKVLLQIQPVETPASLKTKREFGQQKGVVLYIAPDFDDYLGDEFWGLSDEKQK